MQNSLKSLRTAALIAASMLIAAACDSGTDQRSAQETSQAPAQETSQTPDQDRSQAASAPAEQSTASSQDSGTDARPSRSDAAPGGAGVRVDEDGVAQVRIGGTDSIEYTLNEFEVEAGQQVELTFTHVGSLGVEQMGHNVVILQSGMDPMEFGTRVSEAGATLDNNYLPEALRSEVVAYTDMIGGGDSVSITFTAPEEPGSYAYLCTFPGHFATMNGVMTVI